MGKNLAKRSNTWHFPQAPRAIFFDKLYQLGTFLPFLTRTRYKATQVELFFSIPGFLGQYEPHWSWLEGPRKLYWIESVKFILRIAGKYITIYT